MAGTGTVAGRYALTIAGAVTGSETGSGTVGRAFTRIAGAVVLYQPDLDRLAEALPTYAPQLDVLYVFANSPVAEFPIDAPRVEWIHSL